jgi:hypothetical protein
MVHGSGLLHSLMLLMELSRPDSHPRNSFKLWILSIREHGNTPTIWILVPVLSPMISYWWIETKLTPEFLSKCTILQKQFQPLLASDSLRAEFEDFLIEYHSYVKDMDESKFMQFIINQPFGGGYDDLIRSVTFRLYWFWSVCQMIAVLPATSIDCERGFSNLNRIKTNGRNRLNGNNLESILRISILGMDAISFMQHREVLIRRWKGARDRRIAGRGDTLIQWG